MGFLLTLWKNRTLVMAGVLALTAVVMWAWIGKLHRNLAERDQAITTLTSQRNSAINIANANAAEVARVQAERDSTVAQLEAERAKAEQLNQATKKIYKEIADAPKANCAAGPRLIAAHRGVRSLVSEAENRD